MLLRQMHTDTSMMQVASDVHMQCPPIFAAIAEYSLKQCCLCLHLAKGEVLKQHGTKLPPG